MSLVVCSLNEEGNVGHVLRRVPKAVDEIVLVDGNSTDGTVAEALAADPRVRAVTQSGLGKGSALRQGIDEARGKVIVQMDADGSMDAQEITRYLDAIWWGADLVKGSRMLPGAGTSDLTRFRRFGNWAFCKAANALHGARFTDICYGFMAYRREVVERLGLASDGFDIEAELALKAHRAGYVVIEVPSYESDRRFGTSNLRAFRDGWSILRTILGPQRTASPAASLPPARAGAGPLRIAGRRVPRE